MAHSIKPTTQKANKGLNITWSLPATPVLTTAEAKTACRIDFNTDDDFVDALVQSGTLMVQNMASRALVNQTVVAEWDSVGYEVPLPVAPVVSITSVQTVDNAGNLTALVAGTGYTLRNNVIRVNTSLGLRVTYTAGYGAASTNVPRPLITAVERIVLSLYDRRDDEVLETNVEQLELNTKAIIAPYIYFR